MMGLLVLQIGNYRPLKPNFQYKFHEDIDTDINVPEQDEPVLHEENQNGTHQVSVRGNQVDQYANDGNGGGRMVQDETHAVETVGNTTVRMILADDW